jgi:hypothetical protein
MLQAARLVPALAAVGSWSTIIFTEEDTAPQVLLTFHTRVLVPEGRLVTMVDGLLILIIEPPAVAKDQVPMPVNGASALAPKVTVPGLTQMVWLEPALDGPGLLSTCMFIVAVLTGQTPFFTVQVSVVRPTTPLLKMEPGVFRNGILTEPGGPIDQVPVPGAGEDPDSTPVGVLTQTV